MSYIATTAGISGVMIRDLMAETIECRFGLVVSGNPIITQYGN
jgi:hypothetical protein